MFRIVFYVIFIFLNSSFLLFGNNLCVEWDSPECASRLNSDAYNKNIFKLMRFYEGQIHPTYCGVASSVIALNALDIKTPQCSRIGSYRIFTQNGFVSAYIDKAIKKSDLERGGLSFNQLTRVLNQLPIKVTKFSALSLSDTELRSQLLLSLQNPNQIILANFNRKELNQGKSGHWSPIAAYDSKSDSFLVLDVARFKHSPFWVKADAFFQAMKTSNRFGESRGFLTIEKI